MTNSGVGTPFYIPPEIVALKSHSYSADYWSFGNLVFECVTGRLPFFVDEHVKRPLWYHQVQRKGKMDIYGTFDEIQGVRFFSSLSSEMCSFRAPYRQALEDWLRSVLQFDPKSRGGYRGDAGRAQCFEQLERLVNVEVVNVFHVPTYTTHSYSVQELGNSVAHLQQRLVKETGVEVQDQLLSATGKNIADFASITMSVPRQGMMADMWWIFLMPLAQPFALPCPETRVCGLVEIVLKEPTTLMPRLMREQAYGECVRLLHGMFGTSQCLMQAQQATILEVMGVSRRLTQEMKQAVDHAQRLVCFVQFLRLNAADLLTGLQSAI